MLFLTGRRKNSQKWDELRICSHIHSNKDDVTQKLESKFFLDLKTLLNDLQANIKHKKGVSLSPKANSKQLTEAHKLTFLTV